MNRNNRINVSLGLIAVAFVLTCALIAVLYPYSASTVATPAKQTFVVQEKLATNTNQELGDHIINVMNYVHSPLSPIERQLTAQTLVSIANNSLDTLDQKKDWIRVIGIESAFDNNAKSTVGAIGLGQIMPQYVKEFGKYCGMKDIRESDANNFLVNATLSACVWHKMLDTVPDHSVILALSAYNSGPSSSSTKNIRKLGSAVPETANYITKFSYLREQTDAIDKKKTAKFTERKARSENEEVN